VLASLPAGALKTRFSIEFPTHAKSRNVNTLGYLDFVDKRNGLTRGFHISQANENGKIKESIRRPRQTRLPEVPKSKGNCAVFQQTNTFLLS